MKLHLKPFLITVLIVTIIGGKSLAQQNVVKLNLPALGLKNITLEYERTINKDMSAALGVSYLLPRNLPALTLFTADTAGTVNNLKLSGFSFTPQFRWYTSASKDAPRGFYVAPFFKYTNYKATTIFPYEQNPGDFVDLDVTGNLIHIGGGVELGYQWLINDKVSIDWWFFGPLFGSGKAILTIMGDIDNINYEKVKSDYVVTVEDLGEVTGEVGKSSSGKDYAKITVQRGLPGYRAGLSLGYAF